MRSYKMVKDPAEKKLLLQKGLKLVNNLLIEARSIPKDNFIEWTTRFIIRQWNDPLRLLCNLLGFTSIKITGELTKDDFIEKLIKIKNKMTKEINKLDR